MCNRFSDKELQALASILKIGSLERLGFSSNNLGDIPESKEAKKAIGQFQAALTSSTLRHLDLSRNNLSSKRWCAALSNGIAGNTALLSLNLRENKFSYKSCLRLLEAVRKAGSIIEIQLAGNNFDPEWLEKVNKFYADTFQTQSHHSAFRLDFSQVSKVKIILRHKELYLHLDEALNSDDSHLARSLEPDENQYLGPQQHEILRSAKTICQRNLEIRKSAENQVISLALPVSTVKNIVCEYLGHTFFSTQRESAPTTEATVSSTSSSEPSMPSKAFGV